MNEQPKLCGKTVAGSVPLDCPRWDAEPEFCPRGLGESTIRYRAQSILMDMVSSGQIRDALLPVEQARDVIAWHDRHQSEQWRRLGLKSAFRRMIKAAPIPTFGILRSAA